MRPFNNARLKSAPTVCYVGSVVQCVLYLNLHFALPAEFFHDLARYICRKLVARLCHTFMTATL